MAYTTIDDPSEYFHTRLYSGNNSGSGLAITNNANAGDFQPDWVWVKRRDSSGSHGLHDSNRGSTKRLPFVMYDIFISVISSSPLLDGVIFLAISMTSLL